MTAAAVRFLNAFDAKLYRAEVALSEAFRTGIGANQNTPEARAQWEQTRLAGEALIRELVQTGEKDAAEAVQSLLNGGSLSDQTTRFNAIRTRLQVLSLTAPAAAVVAADPPQYVTLSDAVLPEKQRAILAALNGLALTAKQLAKEVNGHAKDTSHFQQDHIKPLMDLGRIKNKRSVGGYYRPDAPPTMA